MAERWSEWEVMRRQVAVCGRVIGAPGSCDAIEVRAEGRQSLDTVPVRHDGTYFMLDLPSGDYRVTATGGRGEVFAGRAAHVSRNAAGDVIFAAVDIDTTASDDAPQSRQRRKGRSHH